MDALFRDTSKEAKATKAVELTRITLFLVKNILFSMWDTNVNQAVAFPLKLLWYLPCGIMCHFVF